MEFLKKIVRGILATIDMSATIIASVFVLIVLVMLVYNAMYWTAATLVGTVVGVFYLSKKYHSV